MNQEDSYQFSRALLLLGGIVAIAFGATALGANFFNAGAYSDLLTFSGLLFLMVAGVVTLVTGGQDQGRGSRRGPRSPWLHRIGARRLLIAIAGVWAIISRDTPKGS